MIIAMFSCRCRQENAIFASKLIKFHAAELWKWFQLKHMQLRMDSPNEQSGITALRER